MAEEKAKHELPKLGLIAFICAFVTFTVVGSFLAGGFITPFEGKGDGFVIILLLYVAFRLALTIGSWVYRRIKKKQKRD